MTESATSREVKRQRTERRITRCAQQLTEERGLDGFTLDDLAARADVSRRTLFNYYPGKLDAVLGPVPDITEEARTTFLAGGPTGDLVNDLSALAEVVLDAHDVEREDFERGKRVILGEPRLLPLAHERVESKLGEFAALIQQREGTAISPEQARLLIRLLVTVFECAMAAFVAGDDRPVIELFDLNLSAARTLLA